MNLASLFGDAAREPAECVVKIEGKPIEDLYPLLEEAVVESTRGAADVCTLRFETLRDETGSWQIQDHPDVRPWSKLSVEAKFGSRSEPVFTGFIKHVRAAYPQNKGAAKVEVRAQDESLLLDRHAMLKRRSSSDDPRTDKQAITEAVSEVSQLSLDPSSQDGLTNVALVQHGTAATFIRERAEINGFEFFVREGSIYFGPPRLSGETRPPIMVYAGQRSNCIQFEANFDGHQPDVVRIHRPTEDGQDEETDVEPDLDELGDRPANSADRGLEPYVVLLRPALGIEALDVAAQAMANLHAWKLRAEGELDGDLYGHVLRTYELVPVDGVGETYGGIWYVDAVLHTFTAGGYRQRFKLIRNATGDGALG